MNKILPILFFVILTFLLVHPHGMCFESESDREHCRQQRDMACVRDNQMQRDRLTQEIQSLQVQMDQLGHSKKDIESKKHDIQVRLSSLQAEYISLSREKVFLETAPIEPTIFTPPQLSKAESLQEIKLSASDGATKILIAWLGVDSKSLQWQHLQKSQSLSATKVQISNLRKKENTLYAQNTELDQQLLQVNIRLQKSGKMLVEKNQQSNDCTQNLEYNCTITVCR
jgi:hypothetical protein